MTPTPKGWPETAVGVAHGDLVGPLLDEEPDLVDFVEVPFELLQRSPGVAAIRERVPMVLHCASLSVASNVPPSAAVVEEIGRWTLQLGSPWVGEHLAYIRAVSPEASLEAEDVAPFEIGYTVSPQYSGAVLERVVAAHRQAEAQIGVPLLLENSPLAFEMPGSEMRQSQFIAALTERLGGPRLLLDLTHLLVTCRNTGREAIEVLEELPLHAVVEIHVSGLRQHGGLWWDDHGRSTDPEVFTLLARVLAHTRPRAITFEYNWDGRFPRDVLRRQVGAVRELVARAGG